MDSISTFFDMGGYAAFIWPCYGITAVLMIGILVTSLRTRKNNQEILAALEQKE